MTAAQGHQAQARPCPSEEALLKEYELCQAHVGASSQRSWNATSIFGGGAVAGLALLSRVSPEGLAELAGLVAVILTIVTVVLLWVTMVRRETHTQRIAIRRMCEIEKELGLRRNRYIALLDPVGPDDSPFDQETFSDSYAMKLGPLPRPRTADATVWIGVTLVVAGLLLALIKVGDYYDWANFLADRSDFIHWLTSKRGS